MKTRFEFMPAVWPEEGSVTSPYGNSQLTSGLTRVTDPLYPRVNEIFQDKDGACFVYKIINSVHTYVRIGENSASEVQNGNSDTVDPYRKVMDIATDFSSGVLNGVAIASDDILIGWTNTTLYSIGIDKDSETMEVLSSQSFSGIFKLDAIVAGAYVYVLIINTSFEASIYEWKITGNTTERFLLASGAIASIEQAAFIGSNGNNASFVTLFGNTVKVYKKIANDIVLVEVEPMTIGGDINHSSIAIVKNNNVLGNSGREGYLGFSVFSESDQEGQFIMLSVLSNGTTSFLTESRVFSASKLENSVIIAAKQYDAIDPEGPSMVGITSVTEGVVWASSFTKKFDIADITSIGYIKTIIDASFEVNERTRSLDGETKNMWFSILWVPIVAGIQNAKASTFGIIVTPSDMYAKHLGDFKDTGFVYEQLLAGSNIIPNYFKDGRWLFQGINAGTSTALISIHTPGNLLRKSVIYADTLSSYEANVEEVDAGHINTDYEEAYNAEISNSKIGRSQSFKASSDKVLSPVISGFDPPLYSDSLYGIRSITEVSSGCVFNFDNILASGIFNDKYGGGSEQAIFTFHTGLTKLSVYDRTSKSCFTKDVSFVGLTSGFSIGTARLFGHDDLGVIVVSSDNTIRYGLVPRILDANASSISISLTVLEDVIYLAGKTIFFSNDNSMGATKMDLSSSSIVAKSVDYISLWNRTARAKDLALYPDIMNSQGSLGSVITSELTDISSDMTTGGIIAAEAQGNIIALAVSYRVTAASYNANIAIMKKGQSISPGYDIFNVAGCPFGYGESIKVVFKLTGENSAEIVVLTNASHQLFSCDIGYTNSNKKPVYKLVGTIPNISINRCFATHFGIMHITTASPSSVIQLLNIPYGSKTQVTKFTTSVQCFLVIGNKSYGYESGRLYEQDIETSIVRAHQGTFEEVKATETQATRTIAQTIEGDVVQANGEIRIMPEGVLTCEAGIQIVEDASEYLQYENEFAQLYANYCDAAVSYIWTNRSKQAREITSGLTTASPTTPNWTSGGTGVFGYGVLPNLKIGLCHYYSHLHSGTSLLPSDNKIAIVSCVLGDTSVAILLFKDAAASSGYRVEFGGDCFSDGYSPVSYPRTTTVLSVTNVVTNTPPQGHGGYYGEELTIVASMSVVYQGFTTNIAEVSLTYKSKTFYIAGQETTSAIKINYIHKLAGAITGLDSDKLLLAMNNFYVNCGLAGYLYSWSFIFTPGYSYGTVIYATRAASSVNNNGLANVAGAVKLVTEGGSSFLLCPVAIQGASVDTYGSVVTTTKQSIGFFEISDLANIVYKGSSLLEQTSSTGAADPADNDVFLVQHDIGHQYALPAIVKVRTSRFYGSGHVAINIAAVKFGIPPLIDASNTVAMANCYNRTVTWETEDFKTAGKVFASVMGTRAIICSEISDEFWVTGIASTATYINPIMVGLPFEDITENKDDIINSVDVKFIAHSMVFSMIRNVGSDGAPIRAFAGVNAMLFSSTITTNETEAQGKICSFMINGVGQTRYSITEEPYLTSDKPFTAWWCGNGSFIRQNDCEGISYLLPGNVSSLIDASALINYDNVLYSTDALISDWYAYQPSEVSEVAFTGFSSNTLSEVATQASVFALPCGLKHYYFLSAAVVPAIASLSYNASIISPLGYSETDWSMVEPFKYSMFESGVVPDINYSHFRSTMARIATAVINFETASYAGPEVYSGPVLEPYRTAVFVCTECRESTIFSSLDNGVASRLLMILTKNVASNTILARFGVVNTSAVALTDPVLVSSAKYGSNITTWPILRNIHTEQDGLAFTDGVKVFIAKFDRTKQSLGDFHVSEITSGSPNPTSIMSYVYTVRTTFPKNVGIDDLKFAILDKFEEAKIITFKSDYIIVSNKTIVIRTE